MNIRGRNSIGAFKGGRKVEGVCRENEWYR